MIRRSAFVAIIAIVLSLTVHLFGLSLSSSGLSEPPVAGGGPDAIELGNTFEDFADTPSEPVQPEPAEAPEPPPEPETAEVPTSEAQVASPDPQRVNSPDTGTSAIVQPEAPESPETETADRPDGDEGVRDETAATPPVEPERAGKPPAELPDASMAPATEVADTPEPELQAALPVPETPAVPVVPTQSAPVDSDIPVAEDTDASEQAVTTSIRPRLPERRPPEDTPGTPEGSDKFANLRFPEQTVESPLSVYRREGLDTFRQSKSANRTGGRGPGNSDVTNYAGQVLVHLNRAPVVYVPVRGFAQVFFEINPDGTLAWVDIVDSSGSPEIERAAKEQVRSAAPFPRPPGGKSRKLSFYYQIG